MNCEQYPPPPLAHLRLRQMYEDRGQIEKAGYVLMGGAEAYPDNYFIWMEFCFLLLRLLSKSCLRVCHTALRLSHTISTQNRVNGGLITSGGPQEAIGIFALSDHQPDIGLFWLLRSMHAQLKPHHGPSAVRPAAKLKCNSRVPWTALVLESVASRVLKCLRMPLMMKERDWFDGKSRSW